MNQTLTRPDERALFGLEGKKEDTKKEDTKEESTQEPVQIQLGLFT
jgi:hypothetical protein